MNILKLILNAFEAASFFEAAGAVAKIKMKMKPL
jgi:hypothetical protein